MIERLIPRGLLCASVVLGVLAAPASAAERNAFTPACAESDLRAERQGEVHATALAEAGLTMLQARLNCLAGDEAGALAMYDRVLRVDVVSADTKN